MGFGGLRLGILGGLVGDFRSFCGLGVGGVR